LTHLGDHIHKSLPLLHGQLVDDFAAKLHRAIRRAGDTNFANNLEDDVLGQYVVRQLADQVELHRRRHLDEQLARADDKRAVRHSDAGRKHAKRARIARVGVGPKHELPGPRVALLRKRNVAHALVVWVVLKVGQVADVVKVLEALLVRKVADDVQIPVRHRVLGEDVVVRNQDDALTVPHAGVLPKLLLKRPHHRRPAHVMGHEA
jgi:hypothetical protein